jgi:hypothetical protein
VLSMSRASPGSFFIDVGCYSRCVIEEDTISMQTRTRQMDGNYPKVLESALPVIVDRDGVYVRNS